MKKELIFAYILTTLFFFVLSTILLSFGIDKNVVIMFIFVVGGIVAVGIGVGMLGEMGNLVEAVVGGIVAVGFGIVGARSARLGTEETQGEILIFMSAVIFFGPIVLLFTEGKKLSFGKLFVFFLPIVSTINIAFYFLFQGEQLTSALLFFSALFSMLLVAGYDYILQKEGKKSLFAKKENIEVNVVEKISTTGGSGISSDA